MVGGFWSGPIGTSLACNPHLVVKYEHILISARDRRNESELEKKQLTVIDADV
jgi:hypothetical protein